MSTLPPEEMAVRLLRAELGSGHATVRSLGVIYGFALGTIPPRQPALWAAIDGLIADARGADNARRVRIVGSEVYCAVACQGGLSAQVLGGEIIDGIVETEQASAG